LQVQGLQRATDDTTREVAIKRLASGIDRASHLVEQLLVLARQEASANAGVPFEPLDLAQVGMMSLTDCLLAAQSRQIDLGVHRAEATPIRGHTETLRVLFRNLLDNAIKYTPQGGTVDLDVTIQGDCVMASIEDSGPGIPEADRTRVLDRFYRLHHGGIEGSGLGLAIVKTIADLHGAQVSLDASPRLGGLRVQVSFPLARP
ncbi:MAG TPA: ATP-binding protein, partial [Aquabacterium sp.]|nr:ATP-binding protein [Aquabacterium sp.]